MAFDPSAFTGFATLAVHAGLRPDPATGALLTPIHQTTTYAQDAVGKHRGFTYTRSGNPTVAALERHLGALEDAPSAVSAATGMAALTCLCLAVLRAGDHVVCGQTVYGGTVRFLLRFMARLGVETSFVATSDLDAVEAALRPQTRLAIVETPANPTLELTDIEAVARLTRPRGVLLAVDNTFLTPALQRPLDLGADVTLTSTTKYVEGHDSTVGGAIVSRREDVLEAVRFVQSGAGLAQKPFDAWLTIRGSKTLPHRMRLHSENALRVARFLESDARVRWVRHPFLESSPQLELARRQQRDGGGIVAFELEGGLEAGTRLMNAVRLCALAENLGAVETLITHPATMTHAAVPPEQRLRAGVTDGLVRLSVGLEDPDDVIRDLSSALEAAAGAP
jgi:cystathionine beta-lyase/cystathionine gamma-synthase